ncbi:MAG: hypothetical protein JST75_21300 [Bacteroidetes bacterium]|nr:hypothetical protein [Bacteroidota bacterium]
MNKEEIEEQLKIPLKEIKPRGNNLELYIDFGKIGEISGSSIAAKQIAAQESKRLLWQNIWSEVRNNAIGALKKNTEVKPEYVFIPMQNRLVKVLESRTSATVICIFEYHYNFSSKEWEATIQQ